MFSMLESPMPFCNQPHFYTPHKPSPLSSSPLRSSPLSPRNTNALSSPPATIMPSPSRAPPLNTSHRACPTSGTSSSDSGSSSSRKNAYATRTAKVNPLIHGKNAMDGRETRRNLFLKKVREDQEDKRWKARGGDDEIMRMIWISEQRRREERIKREALGLDEPEEEDGEMLGLDEVMADEVAMQEEEELEAILESLSRNHGESSAMSQSQATIRLQSNIGAEHDQTLTGFDMFRDVGFGVTERRSSMETPYASDDEEYDNIFMNVIQQEKKAASQQGPSNYGDEEMMDMS